MFVSTAISPTTPALLDYGLTTTSTVCSLTPMRLLRLLLSPLLAVCWHGVCDNYCYSLLCVLTGHTFSPLQVDDTSCGLVPQATPKIHVLPPQNGARSPLSENVAHCGGRRPSPSHQGTGRYMFTCQPASLEGSHPPRSGKEKGRCLGVRRPARRDLLHLVAMLLVPVLERRDASRKGLRRPQTPRLACGGQAAGG